MKLFPAAVFFFLLHTCLHAQRPVSKFIKDPKSGCKVWDQFYAPDDSISWSGGCKNKIAEGNGTLIWYSGGKEISRYTGEMKKGRPNGKGKYTANNGFTQEGNFIDGELVNLADAYLPRLSKNILPGKDTSDLYINDGSEQDLFYFALQPAAAIRGTVAFFPATGEKPEEAITTIAAMIQLCSDSGILVIVPAFNSHIYFDAQVNGFLNAVFADAVKKYQAPADKFVIGGFSLGGMQALRYTETANEKSGATTIVPAAVFGADPPVDLENLYDQFARDSSRSFSVSAHNEDLYYLTEMNRLFGGPPAQFRSQYVANSIWSKSEPDGGNARFLRHTPLRIYSDPDIDWQMKERGRDYYDFNAPDQTAMIVQLQREGNKKAEFINALGKGYRPDGTRHPHSWSIIEPNDFVKWCLANISTAN